MKPFAPLLALIIALLLSHAAAALDEDLGNGFHHHGVATPVSNHRGTVATVDGDGRDVVLAWLFDCRGGYALLMLDAATGKSDQIEMPFPPGGDCPYASILSSKKKFYTHFNGNFCEFDPATRAFTFHTTTLRQMAMSMTEDLHGVIWSVTYPSSGLVSFDPATREFKDYGALHKENWPQYQRSIATDDAGWVYFAIGNTLCQIVAFNPQTNETKTILPEEERHQGSAVVFSATDGKVYGHAGRTGEDDWREFHNGEAKVLGKTATFTERSLITSSQGLFHRDFPDGKKLKTCDLVERTLSIEDPKTGETTTNRFDYTSEGAHIMGVAAAPDDTICGGTAFPMRFFSYNPKTDTWINRECYGQWNTIARQGDRFFVGAYSGGYLLEWDPAQPWAATKPDDSASNPLLLTQCNEIIGRPHELFAHPDGKTIVLAGTPGYGFTGGGLLFWNRDTKERTLLEHTAILPDLSTMSLAALPEGKLLGGTTVAPGTGGETKAQQAELYIMDMATKTIEWHAPIVPGAKSYNDLYRTPDGLVYGFTDQAHYFVFDPTTRGIVYQEDTTPAHGPTVSHQGPRIFVPGPNNQLYILFTKSIARVDLPTHTIIPLADSPIPIGNGGDCLDGRLYFAHESHLYSYTLK